MEFQLNPEGGYEAADPNQKVAPNGLRQSPFRDEQDATVYHLVIDVTGGKVFAREMDAPTFKEFSKRQQQFQDMMTRPMMVEQEALQLETQNKFGEAMSLRLKTQEEVAAAQRDNKAFTRWLLERTLAGWSYARPFSMQAFSQLRGDDQQAVVQRIIRASSLGRDEADFLAEDSPVVCEAKTDQTEH